MIMKRLGRRAGTVVVAAVLALASVAVMAVATSSASPKDAPLAGVELSPMMRSALVRAAESCPALTPARLAGQVMEQSKFDPKAVRGVADLSDQDWETWKPWRGADRFYAGASILALAHLTCDLVGRVRSGGLTGDLWLPAVAAYHSGVRAVTAAKGVPGGAKAYVERVEGYAKWYALHERFGGDDATTAPKPSPTPSGSPSPEPKTSSPGSRVSLPVGSARSFRVTTPGVTDQFLRHYENLGDIEPVTSSSDARTKAGATFTIRRGLADDRCYSLESRKYPGRYLRHKDLRVRADANDGTEQFRRDATFCSRRGASPGSVRLESINAPGRNIRHYRGKVWIASDGGEHSFDAPRLYAEDVSWTVTKPWTD
jgi:hypothetical protein